MGERLGAVAFPGNDEPALVGENHQLGPVPGVELGEDARHMRLAGESADLQQSTDLGVGQPTGDQFDDLDLPGGQ
jgi:hypothetical protein